jgi:hypothetical protein
MNNIRRKCSKNSPKATYTCGTTQYFSTTAYDTSRVPQIRLSTRLLNIWHARTHTHTHHYAATVRHFKLNAVGEKGQQRHRHCSVGAVVRTSALCRRDRGTWATVQRVARVQKTWDKHGVWWQETFNDDRNEKKKPRNLPSCPVYPILRVRKEVPCIGSWKISLR